MPTPLTVNPMCKRRWKKYARKVKGVTFNDLYEHYPDLFIDIKREQQLLAKHDIIIFQHPFYWYSSPPILKQLAGPCAGIQLGLRAERACIERKEDIQCGVVRGRARCLHGVGVQPLSRRSVLAPIQPDGLFMPDGLSAAVCGA